jgi:putative membrane protein
LVAVLVVYHLWCGRLMADFKHERNSRGHVWYRWFNELPTVILVAAVALVVVKPF